MYPSIVNKRDHNFQVYNEKFYTIHVVIKFVFAFKNVSLSCTSVYFHWNATDIITYGVDTKKTIK